MASSKNKQNQVTTTVAERILQLAAVQAVLQLNWYDQEHVLLAARRLLRNASHPRSKSHPSEESPSCTRSTQEPFSATALVNELDCPFVKDDEGQILREEKKTEAPGVGHRTDDTFVGSSSACVTDPESSCSREKNTDTSTRGTDPKNPIQKEKKAGTSSSKTDPANRFRRGDASASGTNTETRFGGREKIAACPVHRATACDSFSSSGAHDHLQENHSEHCGEFSQDGEEEPHPSHTDGNNIETDCPRDVTRLNPPGPRSQKITKNPHEQRLPSPQSKNTAEAPLQTIGERIAALRRENSRLQALQTCRQCRRRPANLTLLPCGHFCLCAECGAAFSECPVCGKKVLADVLTYVS